jgi:hypothetical protein
LAETFCLTFKVRHLGRVQFRSSLKDIAIININVKKVLVKAYNSIGKVERYYSLLQQAYKILNSELLSANKESILQITVKAVNDLVGLDSIVPILLVFKAYL